MIADLDTLRTHLGATTTKDDGILVGALQAATAWVYDRVYESKRTDTEVQQAIVLAAAKLYKRRLTPDGFAGWSGDGVVARVVGNDPDVRALLAFKRDMTNAGVA